MSIVRILRLIPARDAAYIAQHRSDPLRQSVRRRVFAAVGLGPLVDIDGIDRCGTPFGGYDGQYARTAAHVESAFPLQRQVAQC